MMSELNYLLTNLGDFKLTKDNYRVDLSNICLLRNILNQRGIELSRMEFSMLLNYNIVPTRYRNLDIKLFKYKILYNSILSAKDIDRDLFWHYNDELQTYKSQLQPKVFWNQYIESEDSNEQIINEYKTLKLAYQLNREHYPIPVQLLKEYTIEEIRTSIEKGCLQYQIPEKETTVKQLLKGERDRREQLARFNQSGKQSD